MEISDTLISLGVSIIGGLGTVWAVMSKYQEKVDNLVTAHNALSIKHENAKSELDKLLEFRTQAQKFIDSKIYTANSPLQLSELGKKLVKDSGFQEIFDKEKDRLVSLLAKTNPKTKYDTQEKARALMDSMGEYAAFLPIQTYAYKNGLDFLQLLRAGSILLRDYYFEKNPEIKS